MDEPLVISIVLSWNNFIDTDECLASLVGQTLKNHRIVVVDNGSVDDSLERLEGRWKDAARFIRAGENLGIARGYNAGIRDALSSGADYVGLFNNDVTVQPDLLEKLLGPFEQDPNTAVTSPVVVYYDRPGLVWFARARYNRWFGLTWYPGRDKPLDLITPESGVSLSSDYLPLCSALISRKALERIGLMDEEFFLSHEDVEWCLRARKQGLERRVVPSAICRHKVGVSRGRRGSNVPTPASAFHQARNGFAVGARHFPRLLIVTFLVGQLALSLPFQLFRMAAAGNWSSIPSYLRGFAAGLRRLFELRLSPKRTPLRPPSPT